MTYSFGFENCCVGPSLPRSQGVGQLILNPLIVSFFFMSGSILVGELPLVGNDEDLELFLSDMDLSVPKTTVRRNGGGLSHWKKRTRT